MFFRDRSGAALLLVLSMSGFGSGCAKQETFYPVTGKILFDGQPLTGVGQGSVSFHGDAVQGNDTMHQPTGAISPNGEYELITIGKKGAPPGKYKVIVSAFANRPEEGPVAPRFLLPKKYYSADTTDLSVEVVARPAAGAYDLQVRKGE